METKFFDRKQESYLKYIKKTHNKLLLLSASETIAILAATMWQTYYIKKYLIIEELFDNNLS